LRRELIDPQIEAHHGRIVKTIGDGILIEFASGVDAVRCAIAVLGGLAPRNAGAAYHFSSRWPCPNLAQTGGWRSGRACPLCPGISRHQLVQLLPKHHLSRCRDI
jgi:hypothetical protein